MATAAAGKALANSGLTAADIDLVVVATCSSVDRTPERRLPGRRQARHHRAGRVRPQHRLLRASPTRWPPSTTPSGPARPATRIVIGAEKLSDFTDWTDRSTCIIFGDGAGAAVVTATAEGEPPASARWSGARRRRRATRSRIEGWRPYIQQEGQAVFRWATTALAPIALQACERAGVAPAELAAFVPHQANARIIDGIAKRLGLSPTRSSPRTSSSPATPRRRASRWPCRSWSSAGRCPRAPGAALRLRRRPDLRRSGRPLPVRPPRGATAPTPPSDGPTAGVHSTPGKEHNSNDP